MTELDDEAAYLLRRAREEKEQAAAAAHPNATAAHRALAERYTTRALMAQIDADEDPLIKK
ncbi:hypothetical protein [Sphingomonas montanisoli]|uniref:Uncharacterized protein n=1 Tax=Sphingomonas montanisoli TaxID=2606412 RepID=A0A5D9CE30_9SPHN|nr:hypothetical protein [Sphingomonas montanisoli]TZG29452.1 hypothetical protein FYJ91_04835 [Sphingomonas montanisoli]